MAIDVRAVEGVLSEIRPRLQMDGGDIEFIALEGDVVKVRLKGACGTCPSAMMTLKMGVERVMKQRIPEVSEVRNVF
ncbi:MAG: hypothetical protein COX57_04305 [Alphaproteobacteria bacterium CG_4_10_14_0_2_um_filter_63_37]|nr:MAG: hypothetical protein AUJ55_07930 [Proteobacteria bacterium CG1_02_64_396]PJA25263.1 MAG: hypothetical protein COX57_04305 [Alphaproteobacteria bacterium CG_4_10_14_0_2_um_filter_63_37]